MIKINKLSNIIGSEIWNIDLSRSVIPSVFEMIKDVFFSSHFLVFKKQNLSPKQFVNFSKLFGELDIHVKNVYHHVEYPEILVLSNKKNINGKPLGFEDAGRYWHSDMSYAKIPPMASILYATDIPDHGGDTYFCNMEQAYNDLDLKEKEFLKTLKAIHSYEASFQGITSANKNRGKLTLDQKKQLNEVIHPVIRTHNQTKRKSIYVNPGFTKGIENRDENEGKLILSKIYKHCLNQKYIFNHKWEKNDLVIWDNSSVLHHATEYDKSQTRHMLRTTIKGSAPYYRD